MLQVLNELETFSESVTVWVDGYNKSLRRKFANNISLKNSSFCLQTEKVWIFTEREKNSTNTPKNCCVPLYTV